jgi:hypothetical protein
MLIKRHEFKKKRTCKSALLESTECLE